MKYEQLLFLTVMLAVVDLVMMGLLVLQAGVADRRRARDRALIQGLVEETEELRNAYHGHEPDAFGGGW